MKDAIAFIITALILMIYAAGCGGTKYVTGPPGPQGATGATGAQGPQGIQGIPGTNGTSCTVSQTNTGALISCSDGTSTTVTNGASGAQGPQGTPGTNGSSCTVTAVPSNPTALNGGSLISCTDGTSSLVLNGATGATGATGAAGTSGTIITAIQFCPGTGSYPSIFPEVGFCIAGNIYAVYSANGGFLTEVLPGTWSSNGINDSCTFTVGPDCQVTNN